MNKLMVLALATAFSMSSFAKDVVPQHGLQHGDRYVRVTKLGGERIKFEKCISGYEASTCQSLGRKKSYSLTELRSQRGTENVQILGSVFLDAGIVLGLGVSGLAAGGAITGTLGTLDAVGPGLIGAAAGLGGGGFLVASVKAINPYEQTKQAQTLNTEVLNDQLVNVSNIDAFIERLDLVLSKF